MLAYQLNQNKPNESDNKKNSKMSSAVKYGCLLSIFFVILAYLYRTPPDDELKERLSVVLSGLLRAEKKVQIAEEKRVAVGFGACEDLFVDVADVFKDLGVQTPDIPEHFNSVGSLEDFEKVFAYFFRHGAAAERYVHNGTLFDEFVRSSLKISSSYTALGGNAPVMANRFNMEGCKVLLGSMMSDELRKYLADGLAVSGGDLEDDDVHLILEYKHGENWGKYSAPRANRFIIHNDQNNPYLSSLEEFVKELTVFSPTLLVVGGLQMMDNFPFKAGERQARLNKLAQVLANTPASTRIHFEMASFAEEQCLRDVINNVVFYADSLGMNEQELPNLHSILSNGTVSLISDPYPRIATTLDQMRSLFKMLEDTPKTHGKRKLTRLHVHTLAYQAIMTKKGSSWKNTMSAAAKASLVANRHTCGSNYIHTHKARMIMDDSFLTSKDDGTRIQFKSDRPVSCWEEGDMEICIAPVLVCTEVKQTAGGGDNISSAGLVLQI